MVSERIILSPGTVGSRVSYNGTKGTVAYIGNVEPLQGLWYGINWDDPTRGKHDGSYEGIKYFKASSETSGSFLSPAKLNFGCTFYEALVNKYQKHDLHELDGTIWGNREIEFVGMEKVSKKQSQVQKIRQVVLDDTLVSSAGSENLGKFLPNVLELHLCNTLFSDLSEILTVCRQLPSLKYLNLSKNHLKPFHLDTIPDMSLPGVKTLLLNETSLNWAQVLSLAKLFPNLVELGLCNNNITYLTEVPFVNLISLDIESNPVNDWNEILKLGTLTKLAVLNVNETGISSISLPSETQVAGQHVCNLFKSLKLLYLCGNKIESWSSVDELDKLITLEHLLLHRNPIMSVDSSETCRQMVIAKVGRLKILDRLEIIPQERRGAELDYLKRFGQQWYQAVSSGDTYLLEKFHSAHPRYLDLVKKHGPPEQSELNDVQTGILKNKLLQINFKFDNKPSVMKKIPSDMTILKLKGLLARLFSLDARLVKLSYECISRPGTMIEIDNDFRKVDFYSLANGDTVFIKAL